MLEQYEFRNNCDNYGCFVCLLMSRVSAWPATIRRLFKSHLNRLLNNCFILKAYFINNKYLYSIYALFKITYIVFHYIILLFYKWPHLIGNYIMSYITLQYNGWTNVWRWCITSTQLFIIPFTLMGLKWHMGV